MLSFTATARCLWICGAFLTALVLVACEDEPTKIKDVTPPAPVSDLTVEINPNTDWALLQWTATGDDDTVGIASAYAIRYAASDSVPWDEMTRQGHALVPKEPGKRESLELPPLENDTPYVFVIRVADEVPNWSDISNRARIRTEDKIPPGKITDLETIESTTTTITIRWTAPGDDGYQGQAVQYDIRFSQSPFVWEDAVRYEDEPLPKEAGEVEELTFTGLEHTSHYTFGIRTADEEMNWSALARTSWSTDNPENAFWWDGFAPYPEGQGIGGPDDPHPLVKSMQVYNGELVVGGRFLRAGSLETRNIARWNERSWSPLGSGIGGTVNGLLVHNGKLIAGGGFDDAGGVSVRSIASWDGSVWSPLGSGLNGVVKQMTVLNGDLYVSGIFRREDQTPAPPIWRWDGVSWYEIESAPLNVYDIAAYEGELYAGGRGEAQDTTYLVARWDGDDWDVVLTLGPIMTWLTPAVTTLMAYQNVLVAAGLGVLEPNLDDVATWNGANWSPLGSPGYNEIDPSVYGLGEYRGNLVAGGVFLRQNPYSRNVAWWDGSEWRRFGSGVYKPDPYEGIALAFADYGGKLYVGGGFILAGRKPSSNIARWDGESPH
jgi:hypothetical protein